MTEQDQYAFPGDRYTQGGVKSGHGQGMTLRDWFAGQAMQGLWSAFNRDWHNPNNYQIDVVARNAYLVADAMLEARK